MIQTEFVKAFFAKWKDSYASMRASFEEHFSDDCRCDQRPFALTVGPTEAVRFMDRLHRRNGGRIAAVPVAGVLELRNGRVAAWREYVDAVGVIHQAAVSGIRESFDWLASRVGK